MSTDLLTHPYYHLLVYHLVHRREIPHDRLLLRGLGV
jgi:hypothetical protein